MTTRRIVVGTRLGWRDIQVETRPITTPRRLQRLYEHEPCERLVAHGTELVGTVGGQRRRFILHIRDDGARTWIVR
ncbi:MAG TPA: hypothetical protein VHL31_00940 [Geminicoccus sp.]|jgi:hypothetical protein|uniref:hypothetical protein n=1 Tax=Geminicoccus sp. TaxID=2024832 RepID=UPI002E3054B9|nr:hypothetical protein [Geminicoccus sp.]HEX2524855.1 hypothetical protein [Geminicoccus sp.]